MVKRFFSGAAIVLIIFSSLISTAAADEESSLPIPPKLEADVRENSQKWGIDEEEALNILKQGGTVQVRSEQTRRVYSGHTVTISRIPPGGHLTSSNIPENIPAEELHTDFSKLPIYDVVNGEYRLDSTEADLSILTIGNPLCSYTVRRIQCIKDLLESLNIEHANLYLLDMGKEVGNSRTDAERYAEKNPGVFVARAEDSSDIYYRLFFEVCRSRGKPGGRYPAICVLDSKCAPIYTTTEILFDEDEFADILRPYATTQNDMTAEGGTPDPSENSTENTEEHAFDVPFLDVEPNAYYYDAVKWAVGENITAGTTASMFSPNNTCTQAQMITFLHRAVGEPAAILENPYSSSLIASGKYYYNAMLWAYQNEVVTDAGLNPDGNCTRADVVTYLWRLAGKPSAGGNPFTDVSAAASYAEAVAWAVRQGITSGTSPATFSPNDSCTRAQIVTFLYRNMV